MTHPNVDRLRAFLDAYATGDEEAMAGAVSADAVWHVAGTHPFSGDYRGREAILEYFRRVGSETGGSLRLEPLELMANGERGAAFLRVTAERGSRRLDVTMAEAVQFDGDGLIREFWAAATDQAAIDGFWSEEPR